jgi:hypothetical protein
MVYGIRQINPQLSILPSNRDNEGLRILLEMKGYIRPCELYFRPRSLYLYSTFQIYFYVYRTLEQL